MSPELLVTVYAVYVADTPGPIDADDGVCSTCVALFGDAEDAITEARERLLEGYSVSIDIGRMTEGEWDAIEEVPDDFTFGRSTDEISALDPVARARADRSTRV